MVANQFLERLAFLRLAAERFLHFMTEVNVNANALAQLPPPEFDLDRLIERIKETLQPPAKSEILAGAIYRREELARLTGFSLSTIIRAEEAGKLTVRYEGRRRYCLGSDVLKWLAGQKEVPA